MQAVKFEDIKQAVSIVDVAERYGLQVKQKGYRYWVICPFHDDKNPSMVLFPDGHFKCFGCGVYGDAIDLTARLFNLTPLEAKQKIASDFGLDVRRPEVERKSLQREKEDELYKAYITLVNETKNELIELECYYRQVIAEGNIRSPDFIEACQNLSLIEYWTDTLFYGDTGEKIFVVKEVKTWVTNRSKKL